MRDIDKNWSNTSTLKYHEEFDNFEEVVKAVNKIAEIAEELNHHPNLKIYDYNKLEIEIYTHDENKITEKDYELAEKIQSILN